MKWPRKLRQILQSIHIHHNLIWPAVIHTLRKHKVRGSMTHSGDFDFVSVQNFECKRLHDFIPFVFLFWCLDQLRD